MTPYIYECIWATAVLSNMYSCTHCWYQKYIPISLYVGHIRPQLITHSAKMDRMSEYFRWIRSVYLLLMPWLFAGLPRSGKNRESQGIRKLRSRPLKICEFCTFYSKSGKSPWILYHLGSIRIIIVAIPTSVVRICFPVLTARSQCFCGPILHCHNLTGSHCGLSTLDISFPKSLWYQCNFIAARPTPRLHQPQPWGKESGVYK